MVNSYHMLGNKFDKLYFHAKPQVKRKKIKIKSFTSLKYQVMQSLKLETWRKFDRLYFHAKSKIKRTKYHKIKFDTSLKNYYHAEFNSGVWKQFGQPILTLNGKKIKSSVVLH